MHSSIAPLVARVPATLTATAQGSGKNHHHHIYGRRRAFRPIFFLAQFLYMYLYLYHYNSRSAHTKHGTPTLHVMSPQEPCKYASSNRNIAHNYYRLNSNNFTTSIRVRLVCIPPLAHVRNNRPGPSGHPDLFWFAVFTSSTGPLLVFGRVEKTYQHQIHYYTRQHVYGCSRAKTEEQLSDSQET